MNRGTLTGSNNTDTDWYSLLKEENVLWEYPGYGPHARYILNENHSDFYINSDCLNFLPELMKDIALLLFNKAVSTTDIKPDWILTYPPFGVTLGRCLAELFKSKFACIKSLQDPHNYSNVQKNEKILLCADDITSGSCMRKTLDAAIQKEVTIIEPIIVIANFSGKAHFNNLPIISLIERDINIWQPENCPLCAAGSTALPARENWLELTKSANGEATIK